MSQLVYSCHHFDAAALDGGGHAEFTRDKGYEYNVEITGQSTTCLDNVTLAKQCKGITKAGARCRHLTDNENQLCWQHSK